jgi:chromosome segregation ATPase
VQNAERALADKQAELARMMSELDERSVLADSQKIEIVALRTQLDSLKERLSDAEKEAKAAEDRVAQLEQRLAAQAIEAEILGRRAHDLETRLTEQSRALSERQSELNQVRGQFEAADNKRETEQTWSSEHDENALLRERINDVAAEVARLASALEGPNSPINAILAQEEAANIGRPVARAGGGTLGERIRALQSRASRLSRQGERTRN